VVEVLSSALQAGPFLQAVTGVNVGHFFLAIDIGSFNDLDDFKRSSGEVMRQLRASRKAPGAERIYTPGEKEFLHWQKTMDVGTPLNKSIREELIQMRDELSLTGYDWHF
jgi:LDH2 family malate/lactate/ureidoglycolate dehydrogenase